MQSDKKRGPARKASAVKNKHLPLRYDADRIDPWLDALLPAIAGDKQFAAVRVTRATIVRMAVDEGLKVLSKRYGVKSEE